MSSKNTLAIKIEPISLMKFTLPTISMMIFISTYVIIDGIFVSKFIGTNALSAVNIAYPVFSVIIAIAIMLGTGGSAVCGFKVGENKINEARKFFSLIVYFGIVIGIIISFIGLTFTETIVKMLGATDIILNDCIKYTKAICFFAPFGVLQMIFQYYFVTEGKPIIGLISTIFAGLSNMILDYIFIVKMGIGVLGAGLATGIGFMIPSIFGIIYFTLNKKGLFYFVKSKIDFNIIKKVCSNGISEMITNISIAVTTFLFNIIMINIAGEDGVAAITIILYAQALINALYLGYVSGIAPLISYNYGNDNRNNLKKLFKYSIIFNIASSFILIFFSYNIGDDLVEMFTPYKSTVYNMALKGYNIFLISILFSSINIFASAMFTAYSNGKNSGIIAFLRTFVFLIISVIGLPYIIGINGIWIAIPFAEILTSIVSIWFLIKNRNKYHLF